jgi:hypothetical protein
MLKEFLMTRTRAIRGGWLVCAALTAVVALVCASAAGAQTTIGPIAWQDSLSATDVGLVPCYPNLAGTLTGTDTGAGQFVVTSTGVHVEGVETQTYRIDFANGWYLLSSSPTHFDGNFNFSGGQMESTFAQQDRGSLYDANGQPLGNLDVWGVTHLTWRDLNGNGQPDPGEITANVNLFKFSCP